MANKKAIFWGLTAATLYALNIPFSKIILNNASPIMLAAFLYLGAGMGMLCMETIKKQRNKKLKEYPLTKEDIPYTIAMVILDILAPIFLLLGLSFTSAPNASLLNNFEIVTTSLIAFIFFKEKINPRLWLGITLVTIAGIILTLKDHQSLSFSIGSLFIITATFCWGLENNCTRCIAHKSPGEIVTIKGFGSGLGSLFIAILIGNQAPPITTILSALILGFISYGLSIYFYVYAQRYLGAAKTAAYYSVAPFIGVFISLLIFREIPQPYFFAALIIMAAGTYYTSTDYKYQIKEYVTANNEEK